MVCFRKKNWLTVYNIHKNLLTNLSTVKDKFTFPINHLITGSSVEQNSIYENVGCRGMEALITAPSNML